MASSLNSSLNHSLGFPGGTTGKESARSVGGPGSIPGLERSPGEGNGKPIPGFLPGGFHGRRSLAGKSPWAGRQTELNS